MKQVTIILDGVKPCSNVQQLRFPQICYTDLIKTHSYDQRPSQYFGSLRPHIVTNSASVTTRMLWPLGTVSYMKAKQENQSITDDLPVMSTAAAAALSPWSIAMEACG